MLECACNMSSINHWHMDDTIKWHARARIRVDHIYAHYLYCDKLFLIIFYHTILVSLIFYSFINSACFTLYWEMKQQLQPWLDNYISITNTADHANKEKKSINPKFIYMKFLLILRKMLKWINIMNELSEHQKRPLQLLYVVLVCRIIFSGPAAEFSFCSPTHPLLLLLLHLDTFIRSNKI